MTGDRWRRALGPGVLFTGAAVGVSHLVQSTRAGALYGLALVGLVVLANVIKYPAFRFGPLYTAATGRSLLDGYRRQGRLALLLYGALTVGTMFTVQGAIALFTAGLLKALTGTGVEIEIVALGLLVLSALLLAFGHFRALDRVSKVVVSLLALSTVAATVLAWPRLELAGASLWPPLDPSRPTLFAPRDLAFIVALVGWMPSAIDVSVWQSLWTLDRARDSGHRATPAESSLDFHLGYLGTAFLALCFLVLGAAVFHGRGVELATRPGAFATQVIDLYASSFGGWARPLIGFAAFLTMFSTMLTVMDGFPRALTVLGRRLAGPEPARPEASPDRTPVYWVVLLLLALGAFLVASRLGRSLPLLVDVATTLSFTTAPVLATLNHRAVTAADVPPRRRPGRALQVFSGVGIAVQVCLAGLYLVSRFG